MYKARKGPLGSLIAMKEISTSHALLGKTLDSREESIGSIMSEVAMIKQQLAHPNIVRYHKCFQVRTMMYHRNTLKINLCAKYGITLPKALYREYCHIT